MARKIFGAVVVNDLGQLLPNTCRGTIQGCLEAAEAGEFFGPGVWQKIKGLGAKVVSVEIVEVETAGAEMLNAGSPVAREVCGGCLSGTHLCLVTIELGKTCACQEPKCRLDQERSFGVDDFFDSEEARDPERWV